TPVEQVWNQLALTWGIQPVLVQMVDHTDEMTAQVDRSLMEMNLVDDGDLVVIAAGSPPGKAGSTNSLKVHKVGDLADSTRVGEATSNKEKLGPWPEKKKKA
ncbi:MAG: pyruvate kinase alpha/beta domain-containing protein, partial [Pseudarthrobacter sp.]